MLRDVARVFKTKGRAYIYIANGHGAWEATLTNVLSKGDKILVLESGRFAIGWGENARRMGVEVEVLKGDMPCRAAGQSKPASRPTAPPRGPHHQGRAGGADDTASGVVNDIAAIAGRCGGQPRAADGRRGGLSGWPPGDGCLGRRRGDAGSRRA